MIHVISYTMDCVTFRKNVESYDSSLIAESQLHIYCRILHEYYLMFIPTKYTFSTGSG